MSSRDLTTESGVLDYFNSKSELGTASHVQALSGGFANFVFRIFLQSPLQIQHVSHQTLIVKHAKTHLKSTFDFAVPLERQVYEVHALRYAQKVFTPDDPVVVPLVVHYDAENAVVIMSDAGTSTVTLKDLLLKHNLSSDIAAATGADLGIFLARLHSYGGDCDDRDVFAQHDWARTITAAVFHAPVNSVLKGTLFNPPISISEAVQRDIDSALEEMTACVKTSKETIIIGDFWTGNVLVQLSSPRDDIPPKLTVIDWEVARIGFSANDVGQFAAEVTLAAEYNSESSAAASILMKRFCAAYRANYANFDPDCAAKAAMHIGSHFISIASSAPPWGDKAGFRRLIAEKGIQYLQKGYLRDREWIESQTLLGELYQ